MKKIYLILASILLALSFHSVRAETAPNITLNIENTQQSITDYKGTLIYLDFWASWCLPCRQSFPWMNDMEAKYKNQGFKVIAVNLDKDKEMVAKFLKKYPVKFTVAYDPSGSSAEQSNVQVMPTSMLIDKQGNIITRHSGFRKKDTAPLEKLIQANL